MPRNGIGTYTLPQGPFTPNTVISSTAVNSDFSDIATALTGSVSSDGQTPINGQLKFPNGGAPAPAHTFANDLTSGMYLIGTGVLGFSCGGVLLFTMDGTKVGVGKSGNVLTLNTGAVINPVSQVIDLASATIPAGWLLCYGQNVSRTAYPELFFQVGTTYGSGDGTTTFGLPDLRGRATFGKDDMGGTAANRITIAGGNFDATILGSNGGIQSGTIGQANLPNVTFTLTGTAAAQSLNSASGLALFGGNQAINSGALSGVFLNNTVVNGGSVTVTANSSSISGTAASGGSGTVFPTLSNAFIFNKIIFAGRP